MAREMLQFTGRREQTVDKRRNKPHIGFWRMLKRLAAIFFVFVIAGQASAGVCGCFTGENEPRHSCCKPKRVDGDAMRPTNCCDTECFLHASENAPQARIEGLAKIAFKAKPTPLIVQSWSFEPVADVRTVKISLFLNHRLQYSRPPNLYLHHHAFLI
jgi:hypothetical protein